MKALLIPNSDKPDALACGADIARILYQNGCTPCVDSALAQCFEGSGAVIGPFDQLLEQCDLIIAIGGDGTIIHAAKHALTANKNILGVNTGRLGFLAQAEPCELPYLLPRLVTGDYTVEKRVVLSAAIRGGSRHFSDYAINDAVIGKAHSCNLIELEIYCDNKYMDSYRADGVIFSTATGSTAYSLSAGGPVIDPKLDAILLTPICPHSLSARSTIFSSNKTIMVGPKKHEGACSNLALSMDGGESIALEPGEYIEITKAPIEARFISFGEKEFFEILSKKIMQRG